MSQLRGQALNPSSSLCLARWLPGLRRTLTRCGRPLGLILLLTISWLGMGLPPALAAEILSVRSATQLQVGDQNRGYLAELACLEVAEANRPEAQEWLRRHGPRGSKVNLRPMGEHDGQLVARVSLLKNGLDLGESLVAEGLAKASPCPDTAGGA